MGYLKAIGFVCILQLEWRKVIAETLGKKGQDLHFSRRVEKKDYLINWRAGSALSHSF